MHGPCTAHFGTAHTQSFIWHWPSKLMAFGGSHEAGHSNRQQDDIGRRLNDQKQDVSERTAKPGARWESGLQKWRTVLWLKGVVFPNPTYRAGFGSNAEMECVAEGDTCETRGGTRRGVTGHATSRGEPDVERWFRREQWTLNVLLRTHVRRMVARGEA